MLSSLGDVCPEIEVQMLLAYEYTVTNAGPDRRFGFLSSQVVAKFPNVSKVAITLRESLSATHNNWHVRPCGPGRAGPGPLAMMGPCRMPHAMPPQRSLIKDDVFCCIAGARFCLTRRATQLTLRPWVLMARRAPYSRPSPPRRPLGGLLRTVDRTNCKK